jgi:hypothetical protein
LGSSAVAAVREGAMLQKRKEPKAKKSVAEALLRDMLGTAAEKLALFEKLKARGGFAGEDQRELQKTENILQMLVAMEKGKE